LFPEAFLQRQEIVSAFEPVPEFQIGLDDFIFKAPFPRTIATIKGLPLKDQVKRFS